MFDTQNPIVLTQFLYWGNLVLFLTKTRKYNILTFFSQQPIDDSTDIQNDEKAAIITTTTAAAGGKLDDKMQRQKLKDRYLQKKKSRKNKHEKADDYGEFNEQDED